MHCCFTKGISLWLKNATVINHHQCETKSLLVPAFCHHQFNSFPASSSFPLWSAPRNWFSFLLHISLLTSLWAVRAQTLSDPFLLAWSLPLCPALQLLFCLVSGPAVNIQSAHFHPAASSCNYFTPPCSTNTLHFSSPIICCRGERERGLWREHGGHPSSWSISLWGLPGEKCLQGGASFWAPEQPLQLEAEAELFISGSIYLLSCN